jgi:hypothetical protein
VFFFILLILFVLCMSGYSLWKPALRKALWILTFVVCLVAFVVYLYSFISSVPIARDCWDKPCPRDCSFSTAASIIGILWISGFVFLSSLTVCVCIFFILFVERCKERPKAQFAVVGDLELDFQATKVEL